MDRKIKEALAWLPGLETLDATTARAAATPDRYSLQYALECRHRSARYARLAMIGDPGILSRAAMEAIDHQIRGAGLGLIVHAHHAHRVSQHLHGLVMSSTDDLTEADEAVDAGWQTTTILPPGTTESVRTPRGRRVVICPALLPGRPAVCNTCGLCDPSRAEPEIVGYPMLGHRRRPG